MVNNDTGQKAAVSKKVKAKPKQNPRKMVYDFEQA